MANKYEITINGITVGAPTQAEAIAMAKALMSDAPKRNGKKPTGAKAQPKAEKVEYKKANGEVVMCTPAQAAHWDAWKANRSTKTLDEVKAEFAAYVPTPEHIAYMKANPNGTAKEYREHGIKVGRGDALKALKRKYIPDYKF